MFFIFKKKDLTRIKSVLIVFIILLSMLTVRLFFLQVFPSERVLSQYQNNQSRNISDCKYMVLDTNGKDLMKYNKKYYLVIDSKPFSLNNYEETLENLMALNFIMKSEKSDFSYVDVMKNGGGVFQISEETLNKINKLENIKGIYTYTYDEVDRKTAWNVSTFLSKIPDEKDIVKDSLDWDINNYLKNNVIPQENFYLDSKSVYSKSELDEKSKENKNLKLTIDKEIEDNIRGVIGKEEFNNLSNIGVILMESDTGKIRAMVQKDESQANINLGIEGNGYEPGSVFKLITLAAALDKGVVTLQDTFTCTGEICKSTVHGKMTVEQALEKSCNDIFAKIGNKVGYNDVMDYAKKSGLFKRVLGLQGEGRNETEGIMPNEDAGMNNISIGQCLTVSPLQILSATNTIVNNGIYIKPYLIDSIMDKDDNVIEKIETQSEKVYSKSTSKQILNSMQEVVNKGTGVRAKVPGVIIGGKTGSATTGDNNTHGWFSGYFKIADKTYTMIIFVPDIAGKGENGEDLGGGNTAAPIFSEVVKSMKNNK